MESGPSRINLELPEANSERIFRKAIRSKEVFLPISNRTYLQKLTTVVNNRHLKPFHSLDEIQHLVETKQFVLANERARTKASELLWDEETVAAFVLALSDKHFIKSYDQMSAYDGRKSLDADGC